MSLSILDLVPKPLYDDEVNTNADLRKENEDLTKTYISLSEFNELGTYKKIVKYPDGLFKVKGSLPG